VVPRHLKKEKNKRERKNQKGLGMKNEPNVMFQAGTLTEKTRGAWRFAVALAMLLIALCTLAPPKHYGDFAEYALTTVALADHASPAIRAPDAARGCALAPAWCGHFHTTEAGIDAGVEVPVPGLLRARGSYYTIHFFAYPALAVLPFKLLPAFGIDPLRCFLVVNSAALFVLGLALLRLFGSARRAALGMLAYLLCGGMLYWQWSSPECFSAASLLAGLILFTTGAPVAGGVLAGLAATQNPPIVFFCACAPLLRTCLAWRSGLSAWGNLRAMFGWRDVAGVSACAALFALPLLFDLYIFGTPSIIGKIATDISLVSSKRLFSFFFDLNQGMVIGVPALAAALLSWRARGRAGWPLALAAAAFSVAMAVPSFSTQNWNSGAAGIMRYALWASMPLLFAFLWRLKLAPRWPAALVVLVLAGQGFAMAHARGYTEVEFSPLAMRVMSTAPGWYNPEPEIFWERVDHRESYPDLNRVVTWTVGGQATKTLYHTSNPSAALQLCGPDATLAPDNHYADADRGWRYINGPVRCTGTARQSN
jgi:hypothetical protein